MKKKLVLLVALLLLTATILCGCMGLIDASAAEPAEQPPFNMERVNHDNNFWYYRDTTTDVLYLAFWDNTGYAGAGGLVAMLDPDTGLPLTYARYLEIYNDTAPED